MADLAREAGIETVALEEGVRLRTRGDVTFAINFAPETRATPAPADARYLLGGPQLPPAGVAAWR
jgi:beta-galactosidase